MKQNNLTAKSKVLTVKEVARGNRMPEKMVREILEEIDARSTCSVEFFNDGKAFQIRLYRNPQ